MKNFVKILLVLLVAVFIFAAIVGFMEMPVAEEGEELTVVEQWIVKLKTYMSEVLTALGVSLNAVLLYIFLTIQKLSANTNATTGAASSEVAGIKGNQEAQQKQITAVGGDIQALSGKMDILMDLFSQTLMLSDLPATVRNKVQEHIDDYGNLKAKVITAVSDDIKKTTAAATEEQKAEFAETIDTIKEGIAKATETYKTIKNTVSRF